MKRKGVLHTIPFFVQFVLFNAIGYGIIIYIEWDGLGIFYDNIKWYELWVPCGISMVISMFSTSIMYGIKGDW